MNRLESLYRNTVVPQLGSELGIANPHALPRIEKIVVNAGIGKSLTDKDYTDAAISVVRNITGQQPVITKAKQSISNFKIREGMPVGLKVTLRGEAMYAFLDKLIHVTLPRVRDFRGLSRRSFDGQGNYSIGLSEHNVFPEISSDDVERTVGLEVNIVTSASDNTQGELLLEKLGLPFEKIDNAHQ